MGTKNYLAEIQYNGYGWVSPQQATRRYFFKAQDDLEAQNLAREKHPEENQYGREYEVENLWEIGVARTQIGKEENTTISLRSVDTKLNEQLNGCENIEGKLEDFESIYMPEISHLISLVEKKR